MQILVIKTATVPESGPRAIQYHEGQTYPDMPDEVAALALKAGWGVEPSSHINLGVIETHEGKLAQEAVLNKAIPTASENK